MQSLTGVFKLGTKTNCKPMIRNQGSNLEPQIIFITVSIIHANDSGKLYKTLLFDLNKADFIYTNVKSTLLTK